MNKPTISETVVPSDTALRLKQKGFDWKIASFYEYTHATPAIPNGLLSGYYFHHRSYVAYSNSEWAKNAAEFKVALCKHIDASHPPISAPTYDMVIDWLLEKGFYVHAERGKRNQFYGVCEDIQAGAVAIHQGYTSYSRYTALNWGILYALGKMNDIKQK